MKKLLLFFCLLTGLATVHAQCPQYVAFDTTICQSTVNRTIDVRGLRSRLCGDSVQITFFDSLTSLNGASKVYLHAGPEFRAFTGFQGAYTGDALMTKVGAHYWTIKINPRTFFNYSADSCLNSIAMGFRDSTSAHYVKDGSNDIFVLTYTGTATVSNNYPYVTATYTHSNAGTFLWNDGRTDSIRVFTTSGNYSVTATGPGGCTATGTVHIHIGNAKVSLGNDTTLCHTGVVAIATPGFASYTWLNSTNPVTSNSYISFNSGCFWVKAIDSLGCISRDTVDIHYSQTWGLKLTDTLTSCPGNPVSIDASTSINASGDSLVIIYDATKGQTQLVGDTNVYFHSGPEFHPFGGWQLPYTVGNFTQNDGIGRMKSLGNNKWRIAIDPQCYYGFNPDTNLNGIFMVFRNFDGTKTGKDSTGADIFVGTAGIFPLHNLAAQPTSAFSGVTASLTARKPITYAWSDGPTTASRSFSTGGVYKVTASDGTCSTSDSVVVIFSNTLTVNLGADTTVCAGQHVVITAPSGYSHYAWSSGDTTASINVTTAATYHVTVTAAGGCQSTGSRRVANSSHPVSLGGDITRCALGSTTLTATSGFVSYAWIGHTAATVSTYPAVNAGCYWVAATDSYGCKSYDTIRVINSAVLSLNIQDSITSCPGNSVAVDASTSITQNGDSLIIIYDATRHSTTDSLVGAAKVYMHSGPEFRPFTGWQTAYTVGNYGQDDGIGQMQSIGNNKWRIAIIPQCYYGYSPDSTLNSVFMVFRNGDGSHSGKDYNNNDINVLTSVTPPTSSFVGVTASRSAASGVTYSWTTPSGTVAGATVNVTTSGLYIVTASSGLCSKSDTLRANFSNNTNINLGADTTICFGDSVRISAGTGYMHYAWSTTDTTASIIVHAAGTYTVSATNGTGCSSTGHRTVRVSHPAVSLGADIIKCNNTPAALTATAGFASYQWIGRAPVAADTFSATKTGCYWVLATDSFGCKAYDTVSVRYSEVLKLSLQDTFRTCPGNLVNLDAGTNITLAGDSITIFYDATQGQSGLVGASKVYMHSGPEFHPFTGWQTAYTVGNYGQDDGIGRMDSLGNNRWKITICPQCYYHYSPDTPLNGIFMVFRNANGTQSGKDNNGNDIFLNLSTATPTSSFAGVTAIHKAAGTLTYAWNTGPTAPAIAVGTSGKYIVTVTDGSGCSNSDTSNVIITNNLSINIGRDTTICQSGSVRFDAGAGYVSYHWSTGDSTRAITVSAAGTYYATVTAGSGCIAVDSARVTVSGTKVNAGADVTRCTAATATLHASTGYASYQWFGTGASSITHAAINDGCYWVKATDSAGCTSYDTVCVSTSAVNGLDAHDTLTVCGGDTAHLDASVSVNAAGDSVVILFDATGTPLAGATKVYMHSGPEFHPFGGWQTAYTVGHYGQDDGVGQMVSTGANKWRIAFIPSCYYGFNPDTSFDGIFMVLRNADGTLSARGPSNADIFVGLATTPATSTVAAVTAHRAGSNAITYAWSNSGSTSPLGSFTTAGTYYVTASEGGCAKIDTVVVNVGTHPVVNLGHDTCLSTGGSVVLNAGSGYTTYLWSTGASTQTITANQSATYWVRVTNSAGCTGSDTILVSSGVSVSLGRDTCLAAGSHIVLSAGAGFASYTWSSGVATQNDTVTQAGTYSVLVVNNAGCKARDTVVVKAGATVSLGNDTCLSQGGSVVLSADSGLASYAWTPSGSVTHTNTVSASGTYSVTVINAAGCRASDTVVVHAAPSVSLGRDTCVTVSGSLTLQTDSSYAAYLWSSGASTSTITVTTAGVYTVTVTAASGCKAFDSVTVTTCPHANPGCHPTPYFRVLNISPGNTVTIKDSSQHRGATTYLWDFGDGITSTTAGSLVHTYASASVYTISLIICDSCGCDTFSKVVYVNSTGITEITGLSDVSLYPNPASNGCTLDILSTENMEVSISVTDIVGAMVQTEKWHVNTGTNKHMIDLTGIASGMYQVTLTSGTGTLTLKLNVIK